MKLSLTDQILIELKILLEKNHDLAYHPARYFFKKEKGYYNKKKEKLTRAIIDRLRQQGYISREEKDGKYLYWITPKGKRKIYKYIFSEKDWDGYWRIVIFDIPEKKKYTRQAFRDKLKELGFLKFQKSVWIGPYDLLDKLDILRKEYQIKPYVLFITTNKVENEQSLKDKFFSKINKK